MAKRTPQSAAPEAPAQDAPQAEQAAPTAEGARSAPSPARRLVATAPDAMVAPRPVPRLRGMGPRCARCGSGMTCFSTVRDKEHVTRYYRCKAPICRQTRKRVESA